MTAQAIRLSREAEKLPPLERIELIEHLFISLDSKADRKRIDKLWAEESEDRISAYERGEMKSIPASEVFKKLELKRK
jgi:putative addiction module component (TIGR02574 family)